MDGFLPPSSAYPQGKWVAIAADRTVGGTFVNGVCRNRLDLTAVQGLTPYTKVRIAAHAYTMLRGEFIYQAPAKVSVGFKQSTGGGY